MSTAAIITIAVVVVIVLGAIAFITAARRSDVRGAGALSRETRKRDKDAEIDLPVAATSTDVELAGEQARAGTTTTLVKVESTAPVAFVPPDPEVIGVNRRHFLNVSMVTLMSAGLGTFAAAGFVAFLWPTGTAGFGGKINVGKMDDVLTGIENGSGFFYNATAKSWITPYPSEALPKAKAVAAYAPVLADDGAGHRRALPEVPAPRLSRSLVRQQPVVRVPVPRFAVQPRRGEEGRAGAARHGPLRRDDELQR